jgi:hypothetical protein
MKLRLATLALVLSMAAPAWAGWDWSTPAKGAVIGGGLGLLAGGAYGSSTDSTGAGVLTGALVGAGLGAAGGAAVGAGVDAVAPRHRSFAPNYSYPYYDTSYNGAPYYGAQYNGGAYSGAPYYGNQYYADPNYGYPYSQGGYWGHRHKHKHHHHDFDDDDDDD